jgi:polyisoprenoid-binding protein YceI
MRLTILCLVASVLYPSVGRAQATAEAPVSKVTLVASAIKFNVDASMAIKGTFDKWDANLTFASPDVKTGHLEIKIQAASVNTGSGMKDERLSQSRHWE